MQDFEEGVNIVVVNYRTYDDLIKFVQSYEFQLNSGINTDLIIVDVDVDGDQYDLAKEKLSQFKHLDFQYWPISYNCGYSGACNFASTTTDKEVMAFFNADTQLHNTTVYDCYEALMEHSDWAVVGPLQTSSSGHITHGGIVGSNRHPKMRNWQGTDLSTVNDVREAVTVSGSAYFVKREAWNEALNNPQWKQMYPECEGAFLPTPHYYEETWFSYFIRHLGWKVMYLGTTDMIHEWHMASPVGSVENSHMATSRAMFRNACDFIGMDRD